MIELKNLHLSFGGKNILNGFDFKIPESGITCLFGPSGCGKTTLLNVVAGLVSPGGGEGYEHGKNVSYLFQEFEKNARKKALYYLEMVGLGADADTPVLKLSGGMQRRVAIARSIAMHADIYLLDEPFRALDPALKKSIMELYTDISKEKPIILVTHDADEAIYLSDTIHIMSGPPLKIERTLSLFHPPNGERDERFIERYKKEMENF
jgi:NitT/TauT family transport system ATP-binding protein